MSAASFNPAALAACLALKQAYDRADEDNPARDRDSVDWNDVDVAMDLAAEALRDPEAQLALDLIGTLETLVASLDEGLPRRDIINYINTQARIVVQRIKPNEHTRIAGGGASDRP